MEATYYPNSDDSNFLQTVVFRGNAAQEISSEYVLPDYIGDVQRLLFTSVRMKSCDWEHQVNQILIRGEAVFHVIFVTEEGKLQSSVFSLDYQTASDLPPEASQQSTVDESGFGVSVYPVCESPSGRLLSPRKLSVKGRVRCPFTVYSSVPSLPNCTGDHTQSDEGALQYLYGTTDSARLFRAEHGNLPFSEDLTVDGAGQIGELLYVGADVSLPDCRFSSGNVAVSGEITLTALYTDTDGVPNCISRRFPISHQSKDSESSADGIGAWAYGYVDSIKASIQPNAYGENRVIETDLTWSYSAEGSVNRPTRFLHDTYSTDYVCDTTYDSVPVYRAKANDRLHFSVNDTQKRADISAPAIDRIIHGTLTVQPGSLSQSENGRLRFRSAADVILLAESDGEYRAVKYSIPLQYDSDFQAVEGFTDIRVSADAPRFRADTDSISCDFEVNLFVTALEKSAQRCVREISFDNRNPLPPQQQSPITLYYPSQGETVWDIARRFRTTSDAVMAANHMNGDTVHGEKVLLIPKSEKKPMFSAVIG